MAYFLRTNYISTFFMAPSEVELIKSYCTCEANDVVLGLAILDEGQRRDDSEKKAKELVTKCALTE